MFIGLHSLLITCPECSYQGYWYLMTETAMCDNCAHSFPLIKKDEE